MALPAKPGSGPVAESRCYAHMGNSGSSRSEGMEYRFSPALETFLHLAVSRMERGMGACLLLDGPPGGGKTSFARALAQHLGGTCHYYSGSPDRERDLLYEIDVRGVLRHENAWIPGPAWRAFAESSAERFSTLLIDEVDKTNAGFDAFLLRLLEEWTFRTPEGGEVQADPAHLAVVLTTNGRRKLRPEVLRRCQRIHVPLPAGERLERIIQDLAGQRIPDGLLALVVRLAAHMRQADSENAPSPKEIALCCIDLLQLAAADERDADIWRAVAGSWLVKAGGVDALDKAAGFRWARALMAETRAVVV